jgi:glycosyltransferase involved in cell wall biosynthesis
MNVEVSVVIPCYCCRETIGRAVDSVVNQTQLPKQLILVDDGSPDEGETLQMLNYLKDKYSKYFQIDVISLDENQGVSVTRNTGWDMVTEPYVAFLDADDSWHPKKIELQYQWMIKHKGYVLSGHRCGIWVNSKNNIEALSKDVTRIGKLSMMLKNPFSTPTVMLKSNIPFRFRVESLYAEDYLLWQQVLYSGNKVVRLELELAYVHKGLYGDAGLSSHMWAMEKADILNYWILRRQSLIGLIAASCLTVYSFIKYIRRIIVVNFR